MYYETIFSQWDKTHSANRRPFQEWPGNVRLSVLIDTERPRYQAAPRLLKREVCREVYVALHASGGRVLKRGDSGMGWVHADEESAIDKISHGFRTKTRRNSTEDDITPKGTRKVNMWIGDDVEELMPDYDGMVVPDESKSNSEPQEGRRGPNEKRPKLS